MNSSFILPIKKRTWDIELSDVSKDLTDVSTSYMALAEENKRLHSEIESIIEETGDR